MSRGPKLCSRKECYSWENSGRRLHAGVGAGCVGIWSSMGHAEEDSQAAVNTNMSWLLRGWWDPTDMRLDHVTRHALS